MLFTINMPNNGLDRPTAHEHTHRLREAQRANTNNVVVIHILSIEVG